MEEQPLIHYYDAAFDRAIVVPDEIKTVDEALEWVRSGYHIGQGECQNCKRDITVILPRGGYPPHYRGAQEFICEHCKPAERAK